ncbi:glycosyltransferase family 2 protein [Vibrio vulnificus]|uniref:glycosyltransferase family 2 protein n=1 Tax=Vibrio vulnificus TaxID=672 RepID=UPI00304F152B
MKDLISVVIPLYNTEKYIKECVESVLDQDYERFELLVINDGSTDGSRKIVEHLALKDNRIKVINIDNNGVSNARNVGINNASGKYITFIDADDCISKDYLSYMHGICVKTKTKFAVSTNYSRYSNEVYTSKDHIEVWTSSKCTEVFLYPKMTVGCWNKIYDLDFLNKNNIRFKTNLFFGEGLRFITDVSQRVENVGVGKRKVYMYRANIDSCTAVHDVKKAKASFNSLDSIRDNLIIKSPAVLKALKCHYWLNHFLTIRYMKVDKLTKEEIFFRSQSVRYLRRNIKDVIFSKARLKIKISSLVVCVLPNASARLFNKLKNQ